MKAIYEKNELTFALVWIGIYCVLQSLANPLNARVGVAYSASAAFCVLQAVLLFCFLKKNGLLEKYGLCRPAAPARRFLYYLPLAVLATRNFWNGAAIHYPAADTACRLVCMLCVGFVEEIIFRGFLFRALARDNVRTAVAVSSVTFGLGHLLNLVNGSGAGLAETLFQVTGAIAIGFLFVILYSRGKSLLPCILTHSLINMTSTFADETGLTPEKRIVFQLILFAITLGYALALIKLLPESPAADARDGAAE